jgi:hypothetical protein
MFSAEIQLSAELCYLTASSREMVTIASEIQILIGKVSHVR